MTTTLDLDGPAANSTVLPQFRQDDLIRECKSLRRGRGIFTSQIEPRIGPALRAVAGISGDEGPAQIRMKVTDALTRLADHLPPDLRTAAVIAFALVPDSRERLYKERVSLVARRIGRDDRTARRRIDEAIVQIAQFATSPVPLPAPSDGPGPIDCEPEVGESDPRWTRADSDWSSNT